MKLVLPICQHRKQSDRHRLFQLLLYRSWEQKERSPEQSAEIEQIYQVDPYVGLARGEELFTWIIECLSNDFLWWCDREKYKQMFHASAIFALAEYQEDVW